MQRITNMTIPGLSMPSMRYPGIKPFPSCYDVQGMTKLPFETDHTGDRYCANQIF